MVAVQAGSHPPGSADLLASTGAGASCRATSDNERAHDVLLQLPCDWALSRRVLATTS
jgi:hypothetical protein